MLTGEKMRDAAPVVAGVALLKDAERAGLVDSVRLAEIDDLVGQLEGARATPEAQDYFYAPGVGIVHRVDLPVSLAVERGPDGVERIVRTGLRIKKTPVYPKGRVVADEKESRSVDSTLKGREAISALKGLFD